MMCRNLLIGVNSVVWGRSDEARAGRLFWCWTLPLLSRVAEQTLDGIYAVTDGLPQRRLRMKLNPNLCCLTGHYLDVTHFRAELRVLDADSVLAFVEGRIGLPEEA